MPPKEPMKPTILDEIKRQTESNHRMLESSAFMSPIVRKEIGKENYSHILLKFYGFFHPLEENIRKLDIITYLPDFETRRKSSAIIADLAHMGYIGTMRICDDLPPIGSISDAFGCLYVMEGSTLGGRMISKILMETLALGQHNGASFFNGYGEDTGNKWKTFQEKLVAFCEYSKLDAAVIRSANITFEKLREWATATE